MVGQRILQELNNLQWSQQKLADELQISKQVMGKILKGDKNTNILEIRQIADILKVPVEQLLEPIEKEEYIVESVEEDVVPVFMGKVTSQVGKEGLTKAFRIIELITDYQDLYEDKNKVRNRIVSFEGISPAKECERNV